MIAFAVPPRYRAKLVIAPQFGRVSYQYSLVGARGGVHLQVNEYQTGEISWTAGLEFHWREPLEDKPPDHLQCWLLKGACWHDGISLYAEETYLSMVLSDAHQRVFDQLVRDADEKGMSLGGGRDG